MCRICAKKCDAELRTAQDAAAAAARAAAAVQGKVTVLSLATAIPADPARSPDAELSGTGGTGLVTATTHVKAPEYLPRYVKHELTQEEMEWLHEKNT